MPLYRPSELQQILKELSITPKKGLSQNFMVDGNILNKIIATADVQAGDTVLEIGPGIGTLTEALLKSGAHVIAIEKDHLLAQRLRKQENSQLEVIEGDFLKMELPHFKNKIKIKVLSNLPYNISTKAVTKLLKNYALFSQITLTVQKEFALRLLAQPKSKDYSYLTIFTAFYAKTTLNFLIPKTAFYPIPKVDSALITLVPTPPPLEPVEPFLEMLQLAFQMRRKMLTSSLRIYGKEKIKQALNDLHLPLTSRPEELSLDDFLKLFNFLGPLLTKRDP